MARPKETLAIESRAHPGTTGAKAVRREGKIPGVLFGHKSDPMAISVDAKAFEDLLHRGGKNHLLEITIDGTKPDTAIVRDVQRDPISRRVLHADLQRVGASESITTTLPIVTVGVPEGVRTGGGVLDVVTHAIDISGPANELPEHIEVDVSHLDLRHHISAGDLKLPKNFKLVTPADTVIAAVEASKTAAQAEADAPVVPEAAAAVPTVADTRAEKES
jgi:large subunit ribosomal protein L25